MAFCHIVVSHIVLAYEAYLKSCRVSLNSSSFYMRNLRAMYNRAVDTGFTHSWASIAKSKNVPLSVISEGMGHDSEATTRIYLASLNTVAIDKANTLIINSL